MYDDDVSDWCPEQKVVLCSLSHHKIIKKNPKNISMK